MPQWGPSVLTTCPVMCVLTGRGAGLREMESVVPFFLFDLLAPRGFVTGPLSPVLCMLYLRVVGSGLLWRWVAFLQRDRKNVGAGVAYEAGIVVWEGWEYNLVVWIVMNGGPLVSKVLADDARAARGLLNALLAVVLLKAVPGVLPGLHDVPLSSGFLEGVCLPFWVEGGWRALSGGQLLGCGWEDSAYAGRFSGWCDCAALLGRRRLLGPVPAFRSVREGLVVPAYTLGALEEVGGYSGVWGVGARGLTCPCCSPYAGDEDGEISGAPASLKS